MYTLPRSLSDPPLALSPARRQSLSCVNMNFVEVAVLPERTAERKGRGEKCVQSKVAPPSPVP